MFTFLLLRAWLAAPATGESLTTWDGQHNIDRIEVTVVYFVPSDREPLADWRDRIDYFCRRIELFHRRAFQTQSRLQTQVTPEPFVSEYTTRQLRAGDGDFIFFKTLREVDRRLKFGQDETAAFPILLVLSDINWRPLDDFFRLRPANGKLVFEGNYHQNEHFPGAASGGARASYLADRGVGWGLVSADGWRVPYRGSDCVIYHEGCGHTVGLPHPEPADGSVMSTGQYRGWLNESWLERGQKLRLGWKPQEAPRDPEIELFSRFRALPEPRVPKPGQPVALKLEWPEGARIKSLRVRLQTRLSGPWLDVPSPIQQDDAPSGDTGPPASVPLGTFDRPTPVSYRLDAELEDGARVELWNYFQVRASPNQHPLPSVRSGDLFTLTGATDAAATARPDGEEVDLLKLADPQKCWTHGQWSLTPGRLESPKRFGARMELPYSPPAEYQLTVIAEPLDEPDGLILGQRLAGQRFVALLSYTPENVQLSALENLDGRSVGNATTYRGSVFAKNRLSQVVVTVRQDVVTVAVDGRVIIKSAGKKDSYSLGEYWKTPRDDALFLGAYNCRYRFYRVSLQPLVRPQGS